MTNRTLRVRGGLRLKRTLGFCGNSNHSAQRLAEPRRSALAFCHFSILIFFAGGFELEWGGKKAGRASCKETGSGRNEMQMPWCLVHSVIFDRPWRKSTGFNIEILSRTSRLKLPLLLP